MSKFTKNLGLGDGAISIDYSNCPPTLSINLGYYAKDGRRWVLNSEDIMLLTEMVNSYIDDLTNPPPNDVILDDTDWPTQPRRDGSYVD
jgi:hypothetical protein